MDFNHRAFLNRYLEKRSACLSDRTHPFIYGEYFTITSITALSDHGSKIISYRGLMNDRLDDLELEEDIKNGGF